MKHILSTLAALLYSATLAFAQGGLDPTFGNGGLVTTNFGFGGTDDRGFAMALPDGKIVVGGARILCRRFPALS